MSRPLLQTNKNFSLVKFSWLVRRDHLTNCLNKIVSSFFQPNHPSIPLFLSKQTTVKKSTEVYLLSMLSIMNNFVMSLVTNFSIR